MFTKVNINQIFSTPKSKARTYKPRKRADKYKDTKVVMSDAPKLHAYIVGMYEEGVPIIHIAQHFGRSVAYVKKTILKYRTCIVRKPLMREYEHPQLTEPDLLVCGVMFLKAINDKTLNEFFAKVHETNSITTTYAIDRVPSHSIEWLEPESFG